jgi:hypothetical protein
VVIHSGVVGRCGTHSHKHISLEYLCEFRWQYAMVGHGLVMAQVELGCCKLNHICDVWCRYTEILVYLIKLKETLMYEAFDDTKQVTWRDADEINSAMGRVYMHMGLAVLTSMIVSMLVASSPAALTFLFTGWIKWVVMLAPLVAVFGVSLALASNPPMPIAATLLHGFAALMGLSFSMIFAVFTGTSIISAFMGAAVLFGTMSFWGYFTKTSLDSMGKFMMVGLVAIVIVSIINIFISSSLVAMVISALAIIIFLGLTAYDTQQIREALMTTEATSATEIAGALTLYMDFINIFLNLLQLFGDKKE